MGGPARYLAHHCGCRVTGLDLTASRHESAVRLTQLVGLEHLVDFRLGNALEMPFADGSFDVVIGQEAFCHVPDKPRLIAECARVAKPGGVIAFTDILRRAALTRGYVRPPRREMTFLSLESLDGYAALLTANVCRVVAQDDLSDWWTEILVSGWRCTAASKRPRSPGSAPTTSNDGTRPMLSSSACSPRAQLGGGRLVARRGA